MRLRRLSLAQWIFCLTLLPGLALAQSLRFTTLDIGQGDSAVLVAPGGCAVLFDGGPTGSGTTIKAYLKSIGVTRIQMAFVSHLHADHMGGIDEVDVGTDAVPIDAVYDHGGTYSSAAYDEYASHFSGKRIKVTTGQTFSLCNQVTLKVVHAGSTHSDENSKSVTVKISYGAFDALVGGDLTGETPNEETALAPTVGEVELYKVHHHGSRYSSNATFLSTLLPTVSFISVGVGNTYGHPTPECLARLANVGSEVWQTEDPSLNRKYGHIELSSATGDLFTVSQGSSSTTYTSKGGTPDLEAPTAPGALVASAASSSAIDLSWSASTDNVGVTGYTVYRSTNGSTFSQAGTSSTTGFSDLGLSASTTYWYRVTAKDASGNESPESTTASATTGAPPATSLRVTSPNGGESWNGGGSRAITWSSSNISNVKLEYTLDNGGSWTVIASSVAASTGSYTWTVPNSATTQARVRASDAQYGTPVDTSDGAFTIISSSPGQIIINEILANEVGSDTGTEFVELVNVGGTSVDITGWKLWDADLARHTFPSGSFIGPGQSLVVFADAAAIPAGLTNAVVASTGALSLNNTGDTVALKSPRKTVTSYSYTGSLAGTDGVSMNRSPDGSASGGFVLHTSVSTRSASPGTRANGTAF
jgi:beta-lactamase superfamily II metal-dependent hydrolase/chitodextrinase